jgi:hypothetical protein
VLVDGSAGMTDSAAVLVGLVVLADQRTDYDAVTHFTLCSIHTMPSCFYVSMMISKDSLQKSYCKPTLNNFYLKMTIVAHFLSITPRRSLLFTLNGPDLSQLVLRSSRTDYNAAMVIHVI